MVSRAITPPYKMKRWPKGMEMQRPGMDTWELCSQHDVVRACGWRGRNKCVAGETIVSEYGVHYRKVSGPTPSAGP